MNDILGHDYLLLAEEQHGLRAGLATVPSVTEVSRTSLLSGRLLQGNSGTEKAAFAEHPALVEQCRSSYPPVLFHKASLQETEDASLAAPSASTSSSSVKNQPSTMLRSAPWNVSAVPNRSVSWTCRYSAGGVGSTGCGLTNGWLTRS